MSDAPEWHSTDTAAAYLGITPSTLRPLVERGEVAAFQTGRVRRYRTSDLDDFLEHARVIPAHLGGPGLGPVSARPRKHSLAHGSCQIDSDTHTHQE